MSRPRRFTNDRVRALYARYVAGELISEIAASEAAHGTTIRASFQRLKLPYARYPTRRAGRRPQEVVDATRSRPRVEPPFRVRPHEHVWVEDTRVVCVVCDVPRPPLRS